MSNGDTNECKSLAEEHTLAGKSLHKMGLQHLPSICQLCFVAMSQTDTGEEVGKYIICIFLPGLGLADKPNSKALVRWNF